MQKASTALSMLSKLARRENPPYGGRTTERASLQCVSDSRRGNQSVNQRDEIVSRSRAFNSRPRRWKNRVFRLCGFLGFEDTFELLNYSCCGRLT